MTSILCGPITHPCGFEGLGWKHNLWGSEPYWTMEPDNQAILNTIQDALHSAEPGEIEFLASGALNKVFIVKSADIELVARVTLPVDPKWKTMSEVATLRWVLQHTNLPVPEVLTFQADRTSAIGFEWIAMTKMPGRPLAELWQHISLEAKAGIVRQLAAFCAATFQQQFTKIGSLSLTEGKPATSTRPSKVNHNNQFSKLVSPEPIFEVGRIVSMEFFWDNRIRENVNRGPFSTSKEWLLAKLDLAEIRCSKRLERFRAKVKNLEIQGKSSLAGVCSQEQIMGDMEGEHVLAKAYKTGNEHGSNVEENNHAKIEDDKENESDAVNRNSQAEPDKDNAKLQATDESASKKANESEQDYGDDGDEDDEVPLQILERTEIIISRLRSHIDDFFPTNDTNPEPTMIIHEDLSRHNVLVSDEGYLTAVVDWEGVSLMPLWFACQYPPFLRSSDSEEKPEKDTYSKDENGEVDDLYWEDLDDWELTQLRRHFLEEMKLLAPGWVETFQSSERLRDFDLAVSNCDDEIYMRRISNWLDDMESEKTNFMGLYERIEACSP